MLTVLICALISFIVFSFIHFASNNKKPFRRALISVIAGPLTLIAVNLLSTLTSVYIPVTKLSLMTSIAGGVPGTALLVMLSTL